MPAESKRQLSRPTPLIVDALRAATRAAHTAVERAVDLRSITRSRAAYSRILQRFLALYEPWEHAIAAHAELHRFMIDRLKSAWLLQDLVYLGADLGSLEPLFKSAPRLPSQTIAEALGTAYVLEGATLGGQIISRELQRALGLTRGSGATFFNGYGARTRAMWHAFGLHLQEQVRPEIEPDVLEAARAAFTAFESWAGAPAPPPVAPAPPV